MLNDNICTHLIYLSKEQLLNIEAEERILQSKHQAMTNYYLCLHCGKQFNLQSNQQFKCFEMHCFGLEMKQGSIYCNSCNDTIQNMIFSYSGAKDNESYLKMNRFNSYVKQFWMRILSKQGVHQIGQINHRGIKNLGNTCYLSVVLQVLFSSSKLRQLYKQIEIKTQNFKQRLLFKERVINKQIQYYYDDVLNKIEEQTWTVVSSKKSRIEENAKKKRKNKITNIQLNRLFKLFVEEMESNNQQAYNPSQIFAYLFKVDNKYVKGSQQDADELLLLVIDCLNEGERLSLSQDRGYSKIQQHLGFQRLSAIQNIFNFNLYTEIQCAKCHSRQNVIHLQSNILLNIEQTISESYAFEQPLNVNYYKELNYPKNNIHPFLSKYFYTQKLVNIFKCAKCQSSIAFKRSFVIDLPSIFIVTIKRFKPSHKINSFVSFPQLFNCHGISLTQEQATYQLYALIVHQGKTLTTGHYICFIKSQDQWLLCSDEKVQYVSWKYVQKQQAYVLLYSKKQQ